MVNLYVYVYKYIYSIYAQKEHSNFIHTKITLWFISFHLTMMSMSHLLRLDYVDHQITERVIVRHVSINFWRGESSREKLSSDIPRLPWRSWQKEVE